MPVGVLYAIQKSHEHNEHKGDMVSPSSLGKCARSLVLTRTADYSQDPTQLYHAVRGSLIHGFLEEASGLPNVTTEQRLYKRVTANGETFTVSGRFDFVDHANKNLADYKTVADKGIWFLYNVGAKPEHVWQTNVYRWLMHGGHLDSVDGPQVFYDIDTITIHYLFMNRIVTTGTTVVERMSSYDRPKKPYGLQRGPLEEDGVNKYGRTMYKATIDIPAVPVKSFDDVEAYVAEHGSTLARAFRNDPSQSAHVLDVPDERWQCDWCGVKEACLALERSQGQPSLFDAAETYTSDVLEVSL